MAGGTLRLVLGDQLSAGRLASLRDLERGRDVVLMAEVMGEATYVRHHVKKIAFLFSAMRHFAEALRADGVTVDYVRLDDPDNRGSLAAELERAVERHRPERVVVVEPGEHRLERDMQGWRRRCGVPVEIREDDRFLCSRSEFAAWADGQRRLVMESFYRGMRERHGVLMADGGGPVGGRWNLDRENRKGPPGTVAPPAPLTVEPDAITREVLDLVRERFVGRHFGELEPFGFAVTAGEAERAFEHFIEHALPRFGDYQDAMVQDEPHLWHSVLGLYLNCGLLDPLAMIRRAERAHDEGHAPLNAVEGYIRQILGWREYVRGVYWREMPGYAETNFLEARRPLPELYWTGETAMNCLAQAIGQTRREAYAHHIQRLMVTGTFALLLGVEPKAVCEWYLIVYADAYEWVELPNTHGMALFADGGLLATKPYAASGNYINKMSNYCGHCAYDVKKKTGPKACPFNYLYWNFLMENEATLRHNPRISAVYGTLDRMKPDKRRAIGEDTRRFLGEVYGGHAGAAPAAAPAPAEA